MRQKALRLFPDNSRQTEPADRGAPLRLPTCESMQNNVHITLIANAGVLVEHAGIGLLVDGVHHEQGHDFPRVSRSDLMHMRQGTGVFPHVDYLLFTHEHPDHFSPIYVTELIHARTIRGLVLPYCGKPSPELALLLNHIRKNKLPFWSLGLQPGAWRQIELAEGLSVTAVGSRHMGPQYQHLSNDCFVLHIGGKNLLFTGDGDTVRQYYAPVLSGMHLDAVFVNPIFYHHPLGQEIINTIFQPHTIVIYHMPCQDQDNMHLATMVQKSRQRYERSGVATVVLETEKQVLEI